MPIAPALALALAAAHSTAALIVIGDGVDAATLTDAEAALRAEAWEPALTPESVTRASLAAARTRGLGCALREVDCVVQLGVLLPADFVIVAEVSAAEVRMRRVDVNTGALDRAARGVGVAAALAAFRSDDATRAAALVAAPAPAAAVGAAPTEGSALPWLGVGAGAALLVGGGVAAVIGLTPLAQRDAADSHLIDLEGIAATGPVDPGFADDVRTTRATADAADYAWNNVGLPLVIVGAVAGGVGVVLAATGGAMLALE